MSDARLIEAVVRAVLAQLRPEEPPCACHAAAGGCCPDRLGRLVGQGAARFGLQAPRALYPREIARHIDHTLLKPDATREQIETLCAEAAEHGFATVCVEPLLGPALRHAAARDRDPRVHRRRLPAGRHPSGGQGLRGLARGGGRRVRSGHGDQHRRPEVRRLPPGRAGHRRGRAGQPSAAAPSSR